MNWHGLVWFAQAIPCQSFILWLAMKDSLSIGSRMKQWGIEQGCVLCCERDETREHLFFACPNMFTVWSNITGRLLGHSMSPDWDHILVSVFATGQCKMDKVLIRMCFQTAITTLWKERNSRRHEGGWVSVEGTTRAIDRLMRNRISSLRYTGAHKLEGLLKHWFDRLRSNYVDFF